MPALRLTAGTTKTPARKSPARKPAAATTSRTPKRKAPARKAAAAKKPATKPVAVEPVERGPRMPEGWKQRDWDKMIKEFDGALADKQAAQEALTETQTVVNELAMDAIANGVQMSVVSDTLSLSRQRLYDLMELYGVQTERQANNPHPNKGLTQEQIDARAAKDARKPAKPKPAAKRAATKPVAKRTPKRAAKPAATAKRSPARKSPARKPAASNGRGRVTLSRR